MLELAGGTGLWTEQLARENRRVLAVDSSPEAISLNGNRVGGGADRVRYEIADIFSWTPTAQFDAVFFVDSLLEPSSTATDHVIDGSGIVRRRLNDGREFEIVKIFYDPEPLERRLSQLGWRGTVRSPGKFFLFGLFER